MATTVEARMTTSTIWKMEVPDGRVTAGVGNLCLGEERRKGRERKQKYTQASDGARLRQADL